MKHRVDLHYSLASPFPLPTFARALNTRCQRRSESLYKRVPALWNSPVLPSYCRQVRQGCPCLLSPSPQSISAVNSPDTWNMLQQQHVCFKADVYMSQNKNKTTSLCVRRWPKYTWRALGEVAGVQRKTYLQVYLRQQLARIKCANKCVAQVNTTVCGCCE